MHSLSGELRRFARFASHFQPGRTFIILLLLLIETSSVNAHELPQDNISLDVKNTSLRQVFQLIERQSDYTFAYNWQTLEHAKPVTVSVQNASITQVLDLCFASQDLLYELEKKVIIVRSKTPPRNGSAITVSGRVIGEDGKPVEGITVSVKGTRHATMTNASGEFSLENVNPEATLVFSGVNIELLEVNVAGRSSLGVITLKRKVLQEREVVINTGYERISPERTTGSYEIVGNQLLNRRVTPNILERLDGIVPGLIFNRRIGTSNPTDISIRGISTINSDMKPLIVVDNFPYNGDINNINPNDVESITVLKDAAAASIWGTRAGNGVIVITTKSGKYNQPTRITFNTNITVTNKPDLYYLPQFSGSEFVDLETYLFNQGFYNSQLNNRTRWPALSPAVELLQKRRQGLISAADSAMQIDALKDGDIRSDYLKYVYRRAINQQNAISFSGGGNNYNYLFSAGYDRNLASLVGNESERFTIRSTGNLRPLKQLDIQLAMIYTQAKEENNNPGSSLFTAGGRNIYPYAQLADAQGNPLVIDRNYRAGFTDTAGQGLLLDWKYRPLQEIRIGDNTTRLQSVVLNLGARYSINSWLSADVRYQYEKQTTAGRNLNTTQSYYTRNLINLLTPLGGNARVNSVVPFGDILFLNNRDITAHSVRGQLNVNHQFGQLHSLSALLGAELRESRATGNSYNIYGYDPEVISFRNVDMVTRFPTYGSIAGNMSIPSGISFADALNRFISTYGNLAYSFDRRYFVSASARRDGSNLFGVNTNNKWKPLWSVGAGWQINEEAFYHLSAFPLLRLNATYGYSGNVNNSIPGVLTLQNGGFGYVYNLPAFAIRNPPNPDLRWENVRMFNASVEFTLKNERVRGKLEYYQKRSTDLINSIAADPTSGYSVITVNNADLKGEGVDISLNTLNLNRALKWQTNFSFSYNSSKVIRFEPTLKQEVGVYIRPNTLNPIEGENPFALLSWRFAGLDGSGNPQGYVSGNATTNYDSIRYYSTYGELVNHGSARPLIFGNILNSFSWKSFTLSANITYRLKYYFRRQNVINYSALFSSYAQNGYADYQQRWRQPGDEQRTHVPSLIYPANNDRDGFYGNTAINVEKGDHIRLQDINLNYSLTKAAWKKMPFAALNIYIVASNLGIIWKANKAGLDPDYETPLPKSFAGGLRIEF